MNHQSGPHTDNGKGQNHAYKGVNPDWDDVGQMVYYARPYTVAVGETIHEIARRFGITVSRLQEINKSNVAPYPSLVDSNVVKAGDTICVIPDWLKTIDRF